MDELYRQYDREAGKLTELAQIRSEAESSQPQPKRSGKQTAEERIAELTAERNVARKHIEDLERQLSARERTDAELARLRSIVAEREAEQSKIPERIAQAVVQGRNQFANFDDVVRGVQLDAQAFEALLASTSGPLLMYTAGLGIKMLQFLQGLQNQAEAERQRIEHYRQLHRQHIGEQVQ